MKIVVVFLGQSIANELVVSSALGIGHSLHQLCAKTTLEALYLLFFGINKTWGIPRQVVESMHIFSEGLSPLCEPHKFSRLHAHQPWGNAMSPKGQLELLPCYLCISR